MERIDALLDELEVVVARSTPDDGDLVVRGLADLALVVQPTAGERQFFYSVRLAQVNGQGCCYMEQAESIDTSLLGSPALPTQDLPRATRIAVLDAVAAEIPSKPRAAIELEGNLPDKAIARARFLASQVQQLFDLKPGAVILNVGVVGSFLGAFQEIGMQTLATDLETAIIGETFFETTVQDASANSRLLEVADVAIVTGMTMSNGTLTEIICDRRSNAKIVLFAETGASLAPLLIGCGVDAVLSEPFPFYVFGGRSKLEFHSRAPLNGPRAQKWTE